MKSANKIILIKKGNQWIQIQRESKWLSHLNHKSANYLLTKKIKATEQKDHQPSQQACDIEISAVLTCLCGFESSPVVSTWPGWRTGALQLPWYFPLKWIQGVGRLIDCCPCIQLVMLGKQKHFFKKYWQMQINKCCEVRSEMYNKHLITSHSTLYLIGPCCFCLYQCMDGERIGLYLVQLSVSHPVHIV